MIYVILILLDSDYKKPPALLTPNYTHCTHRSREALLIAVWKNYQMVK